MVKKKEIYLFPKTKIGKLSFWLVIAGLILLYLQYWIAMLFSSSVSPPFGLISIALILIFGISSIFSIFKFKDHAVLLYISSFLGLLGILFVIGEFIFPH